jgi:hypothetical protein
MGGRVNQVLELLEQVGLALDDDDIADRLNMNRHYVNQVCRRLADSGTIHRHVGAAGKVVNSVAPRGPAEAAHGGTEASFSADHLVGTPRLRRDVRARQNVEKVISTFSDCIAYFERSEAFPGPSLYFHERALERRVQHGDIHGLLEDERFFEYVYAVLPSWGMHRMGKQAAKVGPFDVMVDSFRSCEDEIQLLWSTIITDVPEHDVDAVASAVWRIIAKLEVSTSGTRIVAGSKALHHVLPNLVPPVDRQYTFRFFTGQMNTTTGEGRAFCEWFPYLCEIGRECRAEIEEALSRRGFMATSPAKVVDNAIMGFMQMRAVGSDPHR